MTVFATEIGSFSLSQGIVQEGGLAGHSEIDARKRKLRRSNWVRTRNGNEHVWGAIVSTMG